MKPEKMSIAGAGPVIAGLTFLYAVAMGLITHFGPPWLVIRGVPHVWLAAAGGLLIAVTLVLHVVSARTLLGGFREGRLVTTGVYTVCRNPLYAWWILLGIPGIAFLLRSWPFLTVPVFMYVVTRIFVRREEALLEGQFGEEYIAYKRRVNAIFPTLRK